MTKKPRPSHSPAKPPITVKPRRTARSASTVGPLSRVLVATDFSAGATLAVRRAAHLPFSDDAQIVLLHAMPEGSTPEDRAQAEGELQTSAEQILAIRRRASTKTIKVRTELAEGGFEQIILSARKFEAELILLGRHGQTRLRDMLLGTTAERVLQKGGTPTLIVSDKARGTYVRPLVAIDLGDAAQKILSAALPLIDPGVQRIPVVHAYQIPFENRLGTGVAGKQHRAHYLQKAEEELSALLDQQPKNGPVWVPVLRKADPRVGILAEAVKRQADLIILGTHSRSGPVRVLLGSVASRIAQSADCDVLVLPPGKVKYIAT